MRFYLLVSLVVLGLFAVSDGQIFEWEWFGSTTNAVSPFNWLCLSPQGCPGASPHFYTNNNDRVRIFDWRAGRQNLTLQNPQTPSDPPIPASTVWPTVGVYSRTGMFSDILFSLIMEGGTSLSMWRIDGWENADFRTTSCSSASVINIELRDETPSAPQFNPRNFDLSGCTGTVILRAAVGGSFGNYKSVARRTSFRNIRDSITFLGGNHLARDWHPESLIEFGNYPDATPVWNVHGNLDKMGNWRARVVLYTPTSNFRIIWHNDSVVTVSSPWSIDDTRPVVGPNLINGILNINNTRLQMQGPWVVAPNAIVQGIGATLNNLTYVAGSSPNGFPGNRFTMGGTFNFLTLFANTSGIVYATTGTFNNVSAIVTSLATGMVWDRMNVPGTATFGAVTLDTSITLANGQFSFDTLTVGNGVTIIFDNAVLTVAGSSYPPPQQ